MKKHLIVALSLTLILSALVYGLAASAQRPARIPVTSADIAEPETITGTEKTAETGPEDVAKCICIDDGRTKTAESSGIMKTSTVIH